MEGEQVCTVPVTNVFVSSPRHAWLPGERGNGSCSVKTFHFPVGLTVNLVSRGQRRHAAGKGVAFLVLEYSLAQQTVAAGLAVTATTPEHRRFPQHPLLQPHCRAQQPAAARVAALLYRQFSMLHQASGKERFQPIPPTQHHSNFSNCSQKTLSLEGLGSVLCVPWLQSAGCPSSGLFLF